MPKVNLAAAFASFDEHWSPRIAGSVNDSHVRLAKLEGAFDWHNHADEDELFLVVSGRLRIRMHARDGGDVDLEPGEFFIVPRGVEHCPETLDGECHVLLLEPKTTLHTGNIVTDRTVAELKELET